MLVMFPTAIMLVGFLPKSSRRLLASALFQHIITIATKHALPLLAVGSGLALVTLYGVQHDLVGIVCIVAVEPLIPVVSCGISEDAAGRVEGSSNNRATDRRVPFEAVLCIFVPEVESAVASGCAEGTVLRVEGDVVDSVDLGDVALCGITVTLE